MDIREQKPADFMLVKTFGETSYFIEESDDYEYLADKAECLNHSFPRKAGQYRVEDLREANAGILG